jgi:hypothetical protein
MKLQDLIEAQIKSANLIGYAHSALEAIGKEATREGGRPETAIFALLKVVSDFAGENYTKAKEIEK